MFSWFGKSKKVGNSVDKLVVLAKDYNDFRRWCVRAGIAPFDCDYISSVENLQAIRPLMVIAVDGWEKNPKYDHPVFIDILRTTRPKVIKALRGSDKL